MVNLRKIILFSSLILAGLFLSSCDPKDKNGNEDTGKLKIGFYHTVGGIDVEYNNMKYVNEAGNPYLVTDIKYFISDVILYRSDGQTVQINDWQDIFYVDSQIPSTMTWDIYDPIPVGHYDSLSFIFGINKDKNISGLFVNPPESNMFWPDFLGGGYHYLQINGKWKNTPNTDHPFNFHTGIGVEVNGNETVYHHTYFRVNLPASSFDIGNDQTTSVGIQMNIESWFKTPHTWDWNIIGGAIMQNWQAMQMAMENGHDVFTRK